MLFKGLMLIPAVFALLRLGTKKYIFSALTTLSCAVLGAKYSGWLTAALLLSCAGDWFLAHRGENDMRYVCGVAGFLLGHLLLIVYASGRVNFSALAPAFGTVLLAAILIYMFKRILPRTPAVLKYAVLAYAVVSVAGFTAALMTGNILYMLGIGLLLFSDMMIAEKDFAGNGKADFLILPTYYLCHLLVTLSAMG